MHLSNTLPHNNRIEIADVLRGFAVMGITLIHFIERSEKEMASQAKKNTISLPVFALITKMTSLIPT